MNDRGKRMLLALLVVVAAAGTVQADVVALQRTGTTVTAGAPLDASFKDAISAGTIAVYCDANTGQDIVDDTYLYPVNSTTRYKNYGLKATGPGSVWMLFKFNLSVLPGFYGGKVNKAELQLYYTAGNTNPKIQQIVTHDWAEGNKNDGFPGAAPAAPGASVAHPMGLNTGSNQTADGTPKTDAASWGPAGDSMFSAADFDATQYSGTYGFNWTGTPYSPTNSTYDGHCKFIITSVVQAWASGAAPNYGLGLNNGNQGFVLSECDADPYQPVLFIDYEPNGPPATVTNLAVTGTDWFKVNLQWTAPTDAPAGPIDHYDIRMSTSEIVDEASFQAATPVTPPAAAAPGTVQTFSVTGLTASTQYWFAIKCYDATGLASPISNIVSATTNPLDMIAPAAITDLAVPTVKPNYVTLTWTASGDDGASGVAASYDLRYSTSPIVDDAAFAAATPVTGLEAPKPAGQAETFTVHGLMPSTMYYFAIKAADEVPNVSALGNVAVITTLEADHYAPNAVMDLEAVPAITMVHLNWSAPADVGTAGVAGYDLRYSTSPIDESNWDAATQVADEPAPGTPGTRQEYIVVGLTPGTTYYFAIKSFDYAEPSNISAISNIRSVTTQPPITPVVVRNPWLVNDRVADTHNITTMGATYGNAYTPDGVFPPTSDEEKAINVYNNQKRRLYHWADDPPNVGGHQISDPTYNQNVFGWSLCGRHADQACTLLNAVGLTPRKIGLPGHWIYEAQYDGAWHAFDTMTTMYVYNKANPAKVASCAEIKADPSLLSNAVADGRACPGFLLCGDTVSWFQDAINSWSSSGSSVQTTRWTGNMDLRLGQTFERTWEAWQNQHPTPATNADSMPGNDPPYHHESQNDWKDSVNFPYWEPYGTILPHIHTSKTTYRRWANGTDTLAPDFRSDGYKSMLEPTSHDIAVYYDDAITPDLHPAAVNVQGEAIFKISVPYYITDASFSGEFVRATSSDVCKVYVSSDGVSWTAVYDAPVGTTTVTNHSLRSNVFARWETWYIKIQIKGVTSLASAGVSNFVVVTTFEHNKGAMAYLDKGINNITVTFDNPAELQASRNILHVAYKWKEYDGTGWNVDRRYDGYFANSPSTFTIAVGGSKVPRTESILMEVIPPVLDPVPPAPILTLAAGAATFSKVPLTWTATGDDGTTGQAMAYDLRYSTTPIVDEESFEAATPVPGVPSPQLAGTAEAFDVIYLPSNTTFYFAIKAIDKGNNRSAMSNVVSATTTSALPISDLAAGSPASGRVSLTWTAIDDGSTGRYASYDLRYSTSPIVDDTSFEAATQVAGVPAPQAAGQAESFIVRGLQPNTTYYFAIKAINGGGIASPLSNLASATTTAPASIGDLQTGPEGSNKMPLTWTAIDDGNFGTFASYDVRYSTAPIVTDADFDAAMQATGEPTPQAPGSAESFVVTGLAGSTTYWFAVKAVDVNGKASPLSNVVSATTTPADVVPPQWIASLIARQSPTSGGVDLTWKAPADYGHAGAGPFTCTSYELRYSTSPILHDDGDATWNAATPVAGLPVPEAPGTLQTFTVAGLTGGTTYYFAIRAADDSGNVSEVSNCASAAASIMGEMTLQRGLNGYNGCLDTYIDPTTANWGGIERMTICGYADYGPENIQRGMIRFDLSSIPAGTVIRKATLSLFSYNDGQRKGSTGFYGAYKLTTDWTYNVTNWTKATSTVNWTTPGGDFLPEPDAVSPKQGVAQVWYDFDVTARVQQWINDASDNFGWIIRCTDEYLHNQDWLYQSEAGTVSKRPKLVLSDLPTPIVGDVNEDGGVDVVDLLYLVDSWGETDTSRVYNVLCDFNLDGIVDVVDLLILVENWPTE